MAASKTPLYDNHEALGARIVDFHGWLMPVQYKGVIEEHNFVRNSAGLFDVCHMGEFLVAGPKAQDYVNHLVTNDISKAEDGQCVYTPMCREDGTIIDDLIVYKHNSGHFMLVVNASNIEKDFSWAKSRLNDLPAGTTLKNVSDKTGLLALQGPKAVEVLSKMCDLDVAGLKRFHFKDDVMVGDAKALVSRTGYTGEDGFELYVSSSDAPKLWETILKAGGDLVQPIGLGARDTLRLESALMLYGNDIDDDTTPFDATIGWTVKLDKGEFIGQDALKKQKASGVKKRLVGFELVDKGVPRQGYKVCVSGKEIGHVTSGTFSPTLGKSIGLAYVKPDYAMVGASFDVIIRDKPYKARVVELPFYRRG